MDIAEIGSTPVYPQAVALAILSGATLILDIPPLIWHLRQRNVAAFSLIIWIVILNFAGFLNASIWPRDNVLDWWDGRGLCDIEAKLFIGGPVGTSCAILSITYNLASVLNTKNSATTLSTLKSRRRMAIDGLLCFGVPALFMILHYIVQPNRYYLFGISGCQPSVDDTWLSIVLISVWPVILAVVDAFLAGMICNSNLADSETVQSSMYR